MRTTKTTTQDIIELDADLTPEDRLEASCASPGTELVWSLMEHQWRSEKRPGEVTMRSLRSRDGKLLLVGGWSSTGYVWMLSTVHAKDYPVETYRGVLECRKLALEQCPRLYNMMMRTNVGHVRLLEAIGAVFTGPVHGINGEPFQAFYIE